MKPTTSVLFVNLNPDLRKISQIVSDELNIQAIFEPNGLDAFLTAKKKSISLIVIYRHSPQLDATSLSVLLKESQDTKDIPVIVICPEVNESELEKCRDAGCSACVLDNCSVEELKTKILEWML
jgi:CheY-like chemotaxis protein